MRLTRLARAIAGACAVVAAAGGCRDDRRTPQGGPGTSTSASHAGAAPAKSRTRASTVDSGDELAAEPEQLTGPRRQFPPVEAWCRALRAEKPADACAPRTVDAWVKRRKKPGAEGRIVLEIPALQRSVDLGSDFTPLRCDGRAFPELPHASFRCSVSGETEMHTDLCSKHAGLVVRYRTFGYFNPGTVREERTDLPCGTRLRFHSMKIRDASWQGFGSNCMRACYDSAERCEDTCYERHADGWGKLSTAGDQCLERCPTRLNACTEVCEKKGQFP